MMTKSFLVFFACLIFAFPVFAVAPAPPNPLIATTTNFSNSTNTPINDVSTNTSTITVSGVGAYLFDVDLTTSIMHTFAADLDITLTSPTGTIVTVTTDNAGTNEHVFNGTLWDDSASTPVTDHLYVNGILASPLTPEGSFGRFIGEDPNGTWTLTINDDLAGDVGNFTWDLNLTTLNAPPTLVNASFTNTTPVAIPSGPATVTSTLVVSGVSPYLFDLNMTTYITHTFAADLEITLTSPAGTIVTVTTDNAGTNEHVFNGTLWDDSASTPVTDHLYVNGILASPLTPEGSFGRFIGEDPNGTWTLTINDDAAADGGSLDQWILDFQLAENPIYTSTPAVGSAVALVGSTTTSDSETITVSETGDSDLTISAVNLTGDPEITLSANPAPFTIVDNSGTTQNITVTCASPTAGSFSATLEVIHNDPLSPATYTITCEISAVPTPVITPTVTPEITPEVTPTSGVSFTPPSQPAFSVFDPAISKIGFLTPGQVGVTGEMLEWVVTVSNTSGVDGQNVVVTDTLIPALRVDNVTSATGIVNISGQTVTVTYPVLSAGQTVQFSIFTTVLEGASITNTACITASNQGPQECATASPISQLPSTGETPAWRDAAVATVALVTLSSIVWAFIKRIL